MPVALRRKTFSPKQRQLPNFQLGLTGESHAKSFLKRRGFLVVAENYLSEEGQEIDLIAIDERFSELTFIEVKTRSSLDFGEPTSALTRGKMQNLRKAAAQFRSEERCRKFRHLPFRFDLITVIIDQKSPSKKLPPRIIHYENVSWLNH